MTSRSRRYQKMRAARAQSLQFLKLLKTGSTVPEISEATGATEDRVRSVLDAMKPFIETAPTPSDVDEIVRAYSAHLATLKEQRRVERITAMRQRDTEKVSP